jgi:hypothetical protein
MARARRSRPDIIEKQRRLSMNFVMNILAVIAGLIVVGSAALDRKWLVDAPSQHWFVVRLGRPFARVLFGIAGLALAGTGIGGTVGLLAVPVLALMFAIYFGARAILPDVEGEHSTLAGRLIVGILAFVLVVAFVYMLLTNFLLLAQ